MSIFIVLPILTLLMFELGLTLQPADFKLFLSRPRPLLVGLAGQLIFLPLVALLLTHCFTLPAVFAVGFVLIACCPGGSSSNVFSLLAKGDVANMRAILRARRDFKAWKGDFEADRKENLAKTIVQDIPEIRPISLILCYYLKGRRHFSEL